jgi:hypothetical protein
MNKRKEKDIKKIEKKIDKIVKSNADIKSTYQFIRNVRN